MHTGCWKWHPEDFSNEMLNDSKQLSEKKRDELRTIIEREALAWAVASVDNNEIDKINILNASIELAAVFNGDDLRKKRKKLQQMLRTKILIFSFSLLFKSVILMLFS